LIPQVSEEEEPPRLMTPSSDKLLQISTGLSSSLTKLLGKTIPAIHTLENSSTSNVIKTPPRNITVLLEDIGIDLKLLSVSNNQQQFFLTEDFIVSIIIKHC
jgi:hypothetical protein